MNLKYEPVCGEIRECIRIAIELAAKARLPCEFTFNDTTVTVEPTHELQVYKAWANTREAT